MLKIFAPRQPARTTVSGLTDIKFDDGRSSIKFQRTATTSNQENWSYLVTNRLPPAPAAKIPESLMPNCALCPPVHFHIRQSEVFHIIQGQAHFLLDSADINKAAVHTAYSGDTVTIEAWRFHTFRNASHEEELVLEFGLNPPAPDRGDERFFRNTQTYRDDCRKHDVPRSLAQVLLFNWYGGVALALPGPQFLAKPLAILLNLFGGIVLGKWLFGFKGSHEEYHSPDKDQSHDKDK